MPTPTYARRSLVWMVLFFCSGPAFAQSECAATGLRENVPYTSQHLRFLAGLGFSQTELEAEPRDEIGCVVTCGGSTLRFCAGEKTTANREFHQQVLPALLQCSLRSAGISAAAVTATVAIEQFRNVARSQAVSLHGIGKGVDVFKIQVGADLHDAERDWKAFLLHRREADIPAFWNDLEICLNETRIYTITAGIGRTDRASLNQQLSELVEAVRGDLALIGTELGSAAVETKVHAVIAQMRTGDLELGPEEYDRKIIPLFSRAIALSARTNESLAEVFAGNLGGIHNVLSELDYYERKGKDHYNHIHMSIPTSLEGFAAGPPPGGRRVRTWDPVYGPEGDDAVETPKP